MQSTVTALKDRDIAAFLTFKRLWDDVILQGYVGIEPSVARLEVGLVLVDPHTAILGLFLFQHRSVTVRTFLTVPLSSQSSHLSSLSSEASVQLSMA